MLNAQIILFIAWASFHYVFHKIHKACFLTIWFIYWYVNNIWHSKLFSGKHFVIQRIHFAHVHPFHLFEWTGNRSELQTTVKKHQFGKYSKGINSSL